MSDAERQLLQMLAHEGKATALSAEERQVARGLETEGLLFIVPNTEFAIITPKGRHKLATIEIGEMPGKKPFGFILAL
jgi:hypothetical protein